MKNIDSLPVRWVGKVSYYGDYRYITNPLETREEVREECTTAVSNFLKDNPQMNPLGFDVVIVAVN